MKKKILIIGNNNGLPGVKVDMTNYELFFNSAMGGSWLSTSEIKAMLNPAREELIDYVNGLKNLSLEYLIVVFSGHGGQRRETVLELNSNGQIVFDSELKNIAKRQLNIYDCCRCLPTNVFESKKLERMTKFLSFSNTREKYERRISQAIPQQVSLYSCSIGESSNDTNEGGIYSKHILNAAKNFTNDEFKLVGNAHVEASDLTIAETKHLPKERQQHPDMVIPRCLTSQQLIIGVNPNS